MIELAAMIFVVVFVITGGMALLSLVFGLFRYKPPRPGPSNPVYHPDIHWKDFEQKKLASPLAE